MNELKNECISKKWRVPLTPAKHYTGCVEPPLEDISWSIVRATNILKEFSPSINSVGNHGQIVVYHNY